MNEQTDSSNCGGCGLTCSTGCTTGHCVVNIFSAASYPIAIAADAQGLWWTDSNLNTFNQLSNGSLTSSTLDDPGGIVVNGINDWVVAQGTAANSGFVLGGGGFNSPVQNFPFWVVLDAAAQNIYWTDGGNSSSSGSVMKGTVSGNVTTPLVTGEDRPAGIAVDSQSVYWTDRDSPGAVKKANLDGSGVVTLASGLNYPFQIVVDSNFAYFTSSGFAGIQKVPIGGGAVSTFVSGSNAFGGLVIDGGFMYWTTYNNPASVVKMPLAGGAMTTLASGVTGTGLAIAVDATSVYFTTIGTSTTTNNGNVVKVTPK